MSWERTKSHEYFLVAGDEMDSERAIDGLQPLRSWLIRHIRVIAFLCILAPSLAMNAFLSYQNTHLRHRPDLGRSSYSI